jgi:hypothetical protein
MVTGRSITRRGKPHVLFRSSQRAGDAGKNLGCVARGEAVVKAMGGCGAARKVYTPAARAAIKAHSDNSFRDASPATAQARRIANIGCRR